MGILYKPLAIVAGMVKKRAGRAASARVWGQLGHPEGPPAPTAGRHSLWALAGSAAVEAATIAAVSAVVDQLFARAFHHLFGAWPAKPDSVTAEAVAGEATEPQST
jgi:hypothetical protein